MERIHFRGADFTLVHEVQRVSPLAGSHVRASITGVFLDTAVAQRMMA
jgi:hypothetical protein